MSMAMAETGQHKPEPTPAQVRRGRRIAFLLFAIGFGPMIVASVMFYTGWMNPTGQSNNGSLIQPPVAVADLGLVTGGGKPLADRFGPEKADATWMMLIVASGECGTECQEQVYLARQVNTALGKNQDRMQRAAYLEQPPKDLSGYPDMPLLNLGSGESPRWPGNVDIGRTPQIYVIDPFGNIMMRYGPGHTGKAMLEDLKHLMKISHIG